MKRKLITIQSKILISYTDDNTEKMATDQAIESLEHLENTFCKDSSRDQFVWAVRPRSVKLIKKNPKKIR